MDRPDAVILRWKCLPPIMSGASALTASVLLILLAAQSQTLAADDAVATSAGPFSWQVAGPQLPDSIAPELKPLWTTAEPRPDVWTIDYQFRSLCSSTTAYEFGTNIPPPYGWAPLSRLEFPINAPWHGLKAGLRTPEWEVQLQWLTPVQDEIHGDCTEYDWWKGDAPFTDLGIAQARWEDGQMADVGLNVLLWSRCFERPVDCWATTGFRWQRFGIMAYDLVQVKENNLWPVPPHAYPGDVISLDQQYWLCYLGGQLRTVLDLPWTPPISWTFQGDWANAQAYNVDRHLLEHRYSMDRTHGDSWHLALTAEAPLTQHISFGFQFDYLQIHTKGSHHVVDRRLNLDSTWDNGVRAWSDQTWLTAFIGFRI